MLPCICQVLACRAMNGRNRLTGVWPGTCYCKVGGAIIYLSISSTDPDGPRGRFVAVNMHLERRLVSHNLLKTRHLAKLFKSSPGEFPRGMRLGRSWGLSQHCAVRESE
jgi:hypothetical protein